MYTLLTNGLIQSGNSVIPPDSENTDYQNYLKWVTAGNTPLLEEAPDSQEPSYFGFYQGLLSEGLPLFLVVRSIADVNLPVSNAYTDLMGAIQFQQFPGFQSSISILFAAMKGAGYEFTEVQTDQMRQLLNQYGFSNVVFPLSEDSPL